MGTKFKTSINLDITSRPFIGIFIPIFNGCPNYRHGKE